MGDVQVGALYQVLRGAAVTAAPVVCQCMGRMASFRTGAGRSLRGHSRDLLVIISLDLRASKMRQGR